MFGGARPTQTDMRRMLAAQQQGGMGGMGGKGGRMGMAPTQRMPQGMPAGLAGLYASRTGGQMPPPAMGATGYMGSQLPPAMGGQQGMLQQLMAARQGAAPQQMGMGGKGQPGGMTPQAGSMIQEFIRQRQAAQGAAPAVPTPELAAAYQSAVQQEAGPTAAPAQPQSVGMYGGGYIR